MAREMAGRYPEEAGPGKDQEMQEDLEKGCDSAELGRPKRAGWAGGRGL
jgi:hypothetical protein